MRPVRLASLAVASALIARAPAHAQELPEGPGKTVVQTVCLQCHGADVISAQRRSREEWESVVARMIGSGAILNDDEYGLVMDYLAAQLGPEGQPASAPGPATPKAPEPKHEN